jgi:hypothetical protein
VKFGLAAMGLLQIQKLQAMMIHSMVRTLFSQDLRPPFGELSQRRSKEKDSIFLSCTRESLLSEAVRKCGPSFAPLSWRSAIGHL